MPNSKSVVSNLLWRFLERSGAHLVTFAVTVIIARIINPDAYGTIAIVSVFISLFQVFVDSGLSVALIQKKDVDDLDYSTVFFTNFVFCLIVYCAIFALAPSIAFFYQDDVLIPVFRVLGIAIIVSGIKSVQQAYVSRNLLFRKFFFSTLGGTIGAAVIGIFLAIKGYGVWALVAQHLFNNIVDTAILWITVKWRPKRLFSIQRLSILWKYGWKLLLSSFIDKFYAELKTLIIGKVYTTSDLAFYNRGESLPSMVIGNINSAIDSVLLPTMSGEQDKTYRVKKITRRAIKTSSFILFPALIGLAVCSDNIVIILLTEKWLPCVPFIRLFCICYALWPIHTANLNAIKALGRSDVFLKLEIVKKIIGLILLFVSVPHGTMAIAYSALFSGFVSLLINTWPNRKILCYGYKEQLFDILPSLVASVLMGLIVYSIYYCALKPVYSLIIQVVIGIVSYIILAILFKNEAYNYIIKAVHNRKLAKGEKIN